MHIQFKRMEAKLRSVDLIVEVHDARVALTGRNPEFYSRIYAIRPHILVLNKMDLIAEKHRGIQHILWTDCKRRAKIALRDLQKVMLNCLRQDNRFNRTVRPEYQVMVIGIPNVGKSSLVNSMRNSNLGLKASAVAEGARPGVTTRVQTRVRILDNPPIYVLDTPGILYPNTRNAEDILKIALCDLMLESKTRPNYAADYLLYWLNKNRDFSYVDYFQLPNGPCDDLPILLKEICKIKSLRTEVAYPTGKLERWDLDKALSLFLQMYRHNKLTDHFLDEDILFREKF
uniref:G domain-containing protein n=1 Tax=Acrobeloides nanus TaxID=290746 RepID=A0A914CJE7_9BILA